jgi:S-adenosyl methyltransferase
MGAMGHVADLDKARSIVGHVMDAVPSGSLLALYDGVHGGDVDEPSDGAQAEYEQTGAVPYKSRRVAP